MALLGPMVVVAEAPATELLDAIGKAGGFPVSEANWPRPPSPISESLPAALVLADAKPPADARLVAAVIKKIESRGGPYMPVLARVDDAAEVAIPSALPIAIEEPSSRLVARLRSALRVRTLHVTVLRRAGASGPPTAKARAFPLPDLLDHATVLCLGRGRSYPELTTAIGERVGLIGALSVETAARYRNSRDIDGIVVRDGFPPRVVEALLTVIAEDVRFRDLPVGMLGTTVVDDERLPNLVRVARGPARLVECLLPLVRLQAFESHLKRVLKS